MRQEKGSLQDIQKKKRKMVKIASLAKQLAETFHDSICPNDKVGWWLYATVFAIGTSSGRNKSWDDRHLDYQVYLWVYQKFNNKDNDTSSFYRTRQGLGTFAGGISLPGISPHLLG